MTDRRRDRAATTTIGRAAARWVTSLNDVPAAHWAALGPAHSFFLTRDWLVSAEDGLTPHPRYLLIDGADGAGPWAGAAAQVTYGDTYLFYDLPRLLTDEDECAAAARWLTDEEARDLAASVAALRQRPTGHPTLTVAASGMASAVSLRGDLTGPRRRSALDAAVAALCAEAERIGADVCALPYLPADADPDLVDALAAAGFHPGSLAAECVLPVPGGTFDDYLATLPGKRRVKVRREHRRFHEAGTRVEFSGVEGLTDTLAPLQSALRRRYGHDSDDAAIARTYAHMRRHLAPYVRVARAVDDTGTVLGFVLFFAVDGGYYVKSGGFRYESIDGLFCYFNLVYYALLEHAQREGVAFIHYGLGSYEAKAARGCRVSELVAYARFTGPHREHLGRLLTLHTRARRRELRPFTGRAGRQEG